MLDDFSIVKREVAEKQMREQVEHPQQEHEKKQSAGCHYGSGLCFARGQDWPLASVVVLACHVSCSTHVLLRSPGCAACVVTVQLWSSFCQLLPALFRRSCWLL